MRPIRPLLAALALLAACRSSGDDAQNGRDEDTGSSGADSDSDGGRDDEADGADAPDEALADAGDDTSPSDAEGGDGSGDPVIDGDAAESDAPDLPAGNGLRLHARGPNIVDSNDRVVLLRGVNLGAWLFHETWISGVDYTEFGRLHQLGAESSEAVGAAVDRVLTAVGSGDGPEWREDVRQGLLTELGEEATAEILDQLDLFPSIYDDSDLPLRQLLERRFGVDGRDSLLNTFQQAWIRSADIAWLAEQGFNLVRVPIGYRTLVTNSDLEDPDVLRWNEAAFSRIGDLLDWCEESGVYAVLDIQESPGGHNDYSGPARLYESETFQALTVGLWEEMSRRYSDRDIVAAYSLLAEPMSAPSSDARDAMYDRLHDAIRARGDDHLLVIHDGFFGMQSLPTPSNLDWTGVVYSTHSFEWGADGVDYYEALTLVNGALYTSTQRRCDCPIFIGSFSTMRDEPWAYESARLLTDFYAEHGWSWSMWTYKRIDDPIEAELLGTQTGWGLRGRLESEFRRPDVYRDDFETLEARFADYADVVLAPNPDLLDALVGPRE